MRWWRTITFENRESPDEWPMLPEVNWWLACSFIVNHIHNGLPHLIHANAVLGNFMIDCWMAVYHYILCIRWYEGARWQNVINPNKFVKPFFCHDIEHSVRCTTDSVAPNELIIVISFFFRFVFLLILVIHHHRHTYGIWNGNIKRASNTKSFSIHIQL